MDRTRYAADIVPISVFAYSKANLCIPVKSTCILLKYIMIKANARRLVGIFRIGRWWKCMDQTRYAADIVPILYGSIVYSKANCTYACKN